jgi:sec-independent protein translocase protein TatA
MFGLGIMEITVILILALVIFGPKRIPEIGKGLGQGIKEFKKIRQEITQDLLKDEEKSTGSSEVPNNSGDAEKS